MANNIIELKVDGMDCNNCATSISRFLERKGLEEVYVNFQTKEVRFRQGQSALSIDKVKAGIQKLGYTVLEDETPEPWWTLERKLLVSAIFTLPLFLGHFLMFFGTTFSFLENPWVQFVICLPPFVIGFLHFGNSAWRSTMGGVPNMDVLIFIGSTAAFIYSLVGTLIGDPNMIFYETSAMIITLVLLGNWLEKRAVQQTTTAIGELTKLQETKAKKVMPSGAIVQIELDELSKGDILQINEGDKIPSDGKVSQGNALVNESMITGESIPIDKSPGDNVVGGAILVSGNIQIEVTAIGKDTLLSQMIELVKTAQQDKPDIQRLADRISEIFVPLVLGIAFLTVLVAYFGFGLPFQKALMNGIAVLVISCPCAMGLATPTAVMVGVGRLARNGILIKGGQTLEVFAKIKNFVFDKTGTLTTGNFQIEKIDYQGQNEAKVNSLIYQMEQRSSHPIAKSLVQEIEPRVNGFDLGQLKIVEEKGIGVIASDLEGNIYKLGSARILTNGRKEGDRQIYLTENDQLLATIQIADTLKDDAAATISYLEEAGYHTIILSGDEEQKTSQAANKLGIKEFYAKQLPQEKLDRIEAITRKAPTAMVGDGINDAPALAKATLGISLSNASEVAIQSAQIVLLNGRLDHLKKAIKISRQTVLTIKQNLFWAFAYNIVAIPIAALGFLNPMWGALFMAFSDVVVIGNSIRLKHKKID